jgi:hypothetical protein
MTPERRRPPAVGTGGRQQIGRAGDRGQGYSTVLGERLTSVAMILEALVAQRPEVDEATLAEVRERLVARAVAGAERYKPCACIECWQEVVR